MSQTDGQPPAVMDLEKALLSEAIAKVRSHFQEKIGSGPTFPFIDGQIVAIPK